MNNNLHELVFILDQSASIEKSIDQLTKSLKSLVLKQKEISCETNVTMSMFGSDFKILYDALPVSKITFKECTFPTSGVCPFIDATANTIEAVGRRLFETAESDRPSRVIVTIVVFGRDNASKKHTYEQLRKMIELQTNTYKWNFFLITDFSIIMEKIGIPVSNTILVKKDEPNCYAKAYQLLDEKITEYRNEALIITV